MSKTNAQEIIRRSEAELARLGVGAAPALELSWRKALAEARAEEGDGPATREAAESWLNAAQARGSTEHFAEASIHLGWYHTRTADYDAALDHFVTALGKDGLAGWPGLRALALHGIGRVHATRGEPERALAPLEEAREVFASVPDRASEAEVLAALGVVQGMRTNRVEASRYFEEALSVFRELGDSRRQLVVQMNLAVVRDDSGDPEGALAEFRRVEALARELASPSDLALALINLGEVLMKLERPGEAVGPLEEALGLSRTASAKQMESWCQENLSLIWERLGDPARALRHAREFQRLKDEMFEAESEARVAEVDARYRAEARDRDIQLLRSENALQLAELKSEQTARIALVAGLAVVSLVLAGVVGRYAAARRHNRLLCERNAEVARQKAELERWQADLERRVLERTEALGAANEELRQEMAQRQEAEAERERLRARYLQAQKMEAVGLLAGGVAHDFNNILTGIGMACELALQDVPPRSAEADAFREVLELSRRASRLTRQLLAFSRKQTLNPTVLHLHELVTHSLRMLERIIGEDIEVRFTAGPEPDTVEVDPAQLEQVMVNLAVNARDAMPEGGRLWIETRRERLEADRMAGGQPLPAGDYMTLRMVDEGVGIDAETLPHIFEPFFTTKPTTRGTGLGLATVYGIVRQHNGAIEVTSELGRGSCFTVWLPCSSKPVSAAGEPATSPRDDAAPGLGRILVLEDDDSIRQLLERLLTRRGYEVLTARKPVEAEGILDVHGEGIALLISDVIMPGANGPDFYARVVAPRFPEMRVIFMSGYSERNVLQTEIIERGRIFLQKPFTPEQLESALRRAWQGMPVELPGPAVAFQAGQMSSLPNPHSHSDPSGLASAATNAPPRAS